MNCPVCPTKDIPNNVLVCPNCQTDLGPILRVRELGDSEYNEALRLYEHGAIDTALQHAAAALTAKADFVLAKKLMGKLLMHKGQIAEARFQWDEAKALAPDDSEIDGLLSTAAAATRRRNMRQLIVIAACVIVLIAGVSLLVLRPIRLLTQQLAKANGALAKSELYRNTHSRLDSDFSGIQVELEKSKIAVIKSQQIMEAYRMTHSHTDKEFENTSVMISNLVAQVTGVHYDISNRFAGQTLAQATIPETSNVRQAKVDKTVMPGQPIANADGVNPVLNEQLPTLNSITASGVTISNAASGISVYFDKGIFLRGTLLRPGAKDILTSLGRQLKDFPRNSVLEINGYSAEKPIFSSAVTLGRKRATIVADFLCDSCGFAAQNIAIRGMSLENLPFPNKTLDSKAKNQTVVIRIYKHD